MRPRTLLPLLGAVLAVAAMAQTKAPQPQPVRPAASAPPAMATAPIRKGISVRSRAPLAIDEALSARQIEANTWVVTDKLPKPHQCLLALSDDGKALLVDTPYTPDETRTLLNWVKERFGQRKLTVINTHYHLEALGGNGALRDAKVGAMGITLTAELLAKKGEAMRQAMIRYLAPKAAETTKLKQLPLLPPPARYFAASYTLPFGSDSFELIYPGPGHSPDNLAVFLAKRKILFAGSLATGDDDLGYLGDANLKLWPKALAELEKRHADVVVPARGERMDPGVLQHTSELVELAAQGKKVKSKKSGERDKSGDVKPTGKGR